MKLSKDYLDIEIDGQIARLTMNRPAKRNAMCDGLLNEIDDFYSNPPEGVRVVILSGEGGHFCSGLDLSEHVARDSAGTMRHSRGWHEVMGKVRYGGLITISVMNGAVIGGGLELAANTHVRIAEPSTIFQLPEGRRGIFVGGGATVNVGRIIGQDRMVEMMLTGRKYGADDGVMLGLAHYSVGEDEGMALAQNLAGKIASNAPLSNYVMVQAIPRINEMPPTEGLFAESLCAALTQTSADAEEGLKAFLEKRAPVFS